MAGKARRRQAELIIYEWYKQANPIQSEHRIKSTCDFISSPPREHTYQSNEDQLEQVAIQVSELSPVDDHLIRLYFDSRVRRSAKEVERDCCIITTEAYIIKVTNALKDRVAAACLLKILS